MEKLICICLTIILLTVIFSCSKYDINNNLEEKLLNGLRPAVYWDNNDVTYNIESRMKYWNVPAVSLVIIDDMNIIYSGAFGIKRMGDSSRVDVNTLFQAASISKPVTAVGAMTLAQKNILPIDSNINTLLNDWHLPYEREDQIISVRDILSHSAGLGVGGFSGYASENELPNLIQIIDGLPPANSHSVRIVTEPRTRFIYSGGGYQILQKIIEDVTDTSFETVMSDYVFKPLNMDHSYYAPLDSTQKENAAFGHTADTFIPNYAPIHIESAAGGLWTTATDLGLLLIDIMKTYNDQQGIILDPSTLQELIEPHYWDFGLGFKVMGEGKDFRFSHGGATTGWHSHFMAYPERGQAVVVMTNGTNGWVLWPEIERSVAKMFNWPNLQPKYINPVELTQEQIAEYVGSYEMNGLAVDIKYNPPLLTFEGAGLAWNLVPLDVDTLEIIDMEGQVCFKRDDHNNVQGFRLWFDEPDWSPYRAWDFNKIDEE